VAMMSRHRAMSLLAVMGPPAVMRRHMARSRLTVMGLHGLTSRLRVMGLRGVTSPPVAMRASMAMGPCLRVRVDAPAGWVDCAQPGLPGVVGVAAPLQRDLDVAEPTSTSREAEGHGGAQPDPPERQRVTRCVIQPRVVVPAVDDRQPSQSQPEGEVPPVADELHGP
jgi:hypothetical protein